jgi:hypothetical protein
MNSSSWILALFLLFSTFSFHNQSAEGQPSLPQAEAGPVQDSWVDNFSEQHPTRWNWAYNAGTGYKKLAGLPQGYSGLEIGVSRFSQAGVYSDCSLHQPNSLYSYGVLEMHLSLSDDNGISDAGRGTRGWGLWDGNLDRIDAAWFWSASEESSPNLTGLRAMLVRDGTLVLNQPLEVDMREWHVYQIDLSSQGTRFWVDGNLVASTPQRPANPQRIELWVDNMAVRMVEQGYERSYLALSLDQKMYIDWVKFQHRDSLIHFVFLPLLGQ